MKNRITYLLMSMMISMTCLMGCGQKEDVADGQVSEVVEAEDVAGTENEQEAEVAQETDKEPETSEQVVISDSKKQVGVLMPNRSSERWVNDGTNMQEKLEALGYDVVLRYADDDIDLQISQIKDMIGKGVDCLVIAAIDGGSFGEIDTIIKEAGIPIIAYDRLLMDIDSVFYYATFDNKGIGILIGQHIEEEMNLAQAKEEGESYTIELFMGSPDDNNAVMLYKGVMEVLQPYFDDGTLVCKSGNTSFEDTCILRYSQETAREVCAAYLEEYYTEESLDIVCSSFDGLSYGVVEALETYGYTVEENWPLITGQDAELAAMKNILNGHQSMSVFKDTRILADKCVTMVKAVLEGSAPQINDTEQYNNHIILVPSYLCEPVAVDSGNYQEVLIESGYYTPEQLAE